MKFTQDDAYKELVSQIPNKGQTLNLSERSINAQLETLIPLIANEETELSDFIEKVLPVFKTADGNVKNDVSVKVKAYQDANPPVPKKDDKTDEPPKKDDANAELLKRIEELEKKNADNEKKSTISQRRSDIMAKMNEKGCKDNEWINELLSEVSLEGEEFDADARVEKYMKMYNKSQAKTTPDVTPKTPKVQGNDSYLDSVIKAAAEKAKQATLGQ